MNYLASGAPNPINSQGMIWCGICHTRGHRSEECLYLQKIVSTLAIPYYTFCRVLGHDEKDYREYQFLPWENNWHISDEKWRTYARWVSLYQQTRGDGLFRVKDEEENMVGEGANSFVIIVDSLDILEDIALILHQSVHIVQHWTTPRRIILSRLLRGRP